MATRNGESSNVESSKPTTVEDLIQLLTTQQRFQHKIMLETQQRLQQEKFFEIMSTFSTLCKQAFLSDNSKKQLCLKLRRSLKHLILLQNCGQITGPVSLHLRKQIQCLMFELLKFFLQIKRQLSTSCFPLLLLRKPRQEL